MKKLHLDEIESLPIAWLGLSWKPVRHALGISAFGIGAYHGEREGDLVVEEHADPHQELYLVVQGRAAFRSDGDEFDAPAGTFVLFEPGEHRVAHAAVPLTTVVAIGAEAARFEPSAWEFAFRSKALFDLGRLDEAREAAEEGLRRYPERADVHYGLAVLEAAEGNRDEALGHLERAVELNSVVRDWAMAEHAFDPIRDDPRFPA